MNDTPTKAGLQTIPQQLTYPLDHDTQEIIGDYVRSLSLNQSHGMQVFTADGTFTIPAGVTSVFAEGSGAGAGSGSATIAPESGTSGGGGAYCRSFIDVTGLSTISVTVGAGGTGAPNTSTANGGDGGDTSFGSYFTAGGGKGDGTGGTATGGGFNQDGGQAGTGFRVSAAGASTNQGRTSGAGGGSFFGPGAPMNFTDAGTSLPGIAATSYGAGASGAVQGTAGGAVSGADGKGGIVIVTY